MVEWKTIEELGSFFGGLTGKTKNDFVDGNANFITYMNVFSNPSLNTSEVGTVKINEGEKQNKIQKGDILFTGSSETPEETGMSCVVTDDLKEDFYMNSFCFGLRLYSPEQVNLHYLKHILRSEPVRKSIAKTASGVTRYNISKARFGKIKIPIPSLSEQQRIVSILDTFTSSISNLKQQIEERRKQYEYERDLLLDLEGKEGVEMKKLGEVFDTRNGYTPSTKNPDFWEEGTIPWFKMEDIRDNGRVLGDSNLHITPKAIKGKGLFKANSIILATSATIGEHALITVEHLSNQRFTNFYPKKKFEGLINMKFVYYYMYLIDEWCKQHINQGGFASVDMNGLFSMDFPLLSLQAQSRIVSILDTFEQSISNLEEQLAMREKQYEYYRNQLLTFEGEEERGKT